MVPFGPRGARLWAAYCERVAGEAGLAVLEELCRTADRLDRLDALLTGDADVWCRLTHNLRTESYELQIDSALGEARQQGAAFTKLLAALPLKESDDDDGGDDWLDNLPAPVLDTEGSAVPDAGT
jgi:hypothetical protein